MALKNIQKALGFPLKVDVILRFRKTAKSIGYTTFWGIRKSISKYLIKPVVSGDFRGPFCKTALKIIKKVLPREGFRNAFSERRETL